MKERRLTQKTNITINIIILATLIITLISAASFGTSIINDIEHKIENNIEQILLIKEIQRIIIAQQREQGGFFIEIKTDLKWIRAALENIQEGN